ncbi:dihydroxyacetone kinase subunit DhaK [Enterococcus ureilyticus]|uniref:phosphoenolpyruvate--glycerone phosphotransferase n=1 Tax=Enterococcus ureilyticus TaxID=1131292 RepID=A0A1E5HDU3_9ENTE|nr:dihydroxyacetone kinase subunit DhaK [Enterococcus ureilyticus]MBM7689858.1 dihydroxyacetone kinase-like protein [Enterococcus ureilyticus]OEG23118.1 dihydroxyacetone kinase subunit DhaK [Enterococcus ureilyticus]
MKKIINQAQNVVPEMVQGFIRAHHEMIEQIPETFVLKQKEIGKQVALISGGGSGHEPAHAGFVGSGMLQAAVCGQVFTSPTPDQILEGIKAIDQGEGVVMIVKNYSGDIMNFDMAKDLAEMEDIKVGTVVVDDDIAVEDSTYTQGKRGVAGTILVHKILGAAARKGASVDELVDLGERVIKNIKTIGVALTGATVPEVGKPGFVLGDDEIEFGVGIHGEPGYKREKIKPSKAMAEELISKLAAAFQWKKGEKFAILVNGLGGTPLMEQYIFYNDAMRLLDNERIKISFSKVGNYMTSLEMAGISITLLKIEADWVEALNEEVDTVAW